MLINKARISLFLVFFISFATSSIFLAIPFFKEEIRTEYLFNLVLKIIEIYSVPIGIIGGSMLGEKINPNLVVSIPTYYFALISSIIWNLIVVLCFFIFACFPDQNDKTLLANINNIVPAILWLIAGCLSYFFSSQK